MWTTEHISIVRVCVSLDCENETMRFISCSSEGELISMSYVSYLCDDVRVI